MSEVTVIIPNLNGKDLLKISLSSLYKSNYKNFDVILVDNGSTDGSVKFIRRFFPKVRVIENRKNLGFAKAVNIAIQKSKSSYVVLLNNDTKVERDWLSRLVASAKSHKSCSSIASKILNFKKRSILESAGDKINIVGQANPIGKGDKSTSYQRGKYVLGATGAASLFKREAIEKVGLFDEDFFFYFEDVDWALRSQLYGFKTFYEPRAIAYHMGGETAKRFERFMEYLRYRNTMLLIIKNFPWQLFFLRKRFIKIPLVFIHTFYFFVKNGLTLEAFKAVGFVVFSLPKFLMKRFTIQKRRQSPISYLDSMMGEKLLKIGSLRF